MITNGVGLGFHLYSNILLPYTALHCLNRTVIEITIMDFLLLSSTWILELWALRARRSADRLIGNTIINSISSTNIGTMQGASDRIFRLLGFRVFKPSNLFWVVFSLSLTFCLPLLL